MPIISISINDKMLEELDQIQSELGFSGRSEIIRAATRMFLADAKEKVTIEGKIKGVLLLVHPHDTENTVTEIKHDFLDIIYTQVHNRFKEGKCLELFILDGESSRIKKLTNEFQKIEKIEYMKFIWT
jgi:CopG family nickel-responsive transcriptional regulator